MTGPTVSIVFEPDSDLGPDPLDDTAQTARRLGEVIPAGSDLIVIWREWGEQFEGGSRTHVVVGGAWENITKQQIETAFAVLGDVS